MGRWDSQLAAAEAEWALLTLACAAGDAAPPPEQPPHLAPRWLPAIGARVRLVGRCPWYPEAHGAVGQVVAQHVAAGQVTLAFPALGARRVAVHVDTVALVREG